MSNPTNVLALDDLKALSGRPIRPVVALENDIKKLQDRVFGIDEEVSELIEISEYGSRRRGGESGTLSVSRVDKGGPVIRLVNSIICRALDEGASDIHVEPRAEELVVRYRIDGVLKRGMSAPLRLKDSVISRFKILGDLDISMYIVKIMALMRRVIHRIAAKMSSRKPVFSAANRHALGPGLRATSRLDKHARQHNM